MDNKELIEAIDDEPETYWPSDEQIARREHFGRYDEEPDCELSPRASAFVSGPGSATRKEARK